MRTVIFTIFFYILLFSQNLYSQVWTCNTVSSAPDLLKSNNISLNSNSISGHVAFRVYFHKVAEDNGDNAITDVEVDYALTILNNYFQSSNISFQSQGVDQINNSAQFNSPNLSLFNINAHSDGIDIYLIPAESPSEGGKTSDGVISGAFYVVGAFQETNELESELIGTSILSHEMGHCLGLWHTHHGTSSGERSGSACAELIDGSNGDICGDYVADTPADPNMHNQVDDGCSYTDTVLEPETGLQYNPDTDNIMSYSIPSCMTVFSPLQAVKIHTTLQESSFLQNMIIPTVTVHQNSSSGNDFGTVGHWESLAFISHGLPYSFTSSLNAIEVLRGSQELLDGPKEKYKEWIGFTDVTNHQEFNISDLITVLTSQFDETKSGVTIKTSLEDPTVQGGNIQFKDPWFIDYADPLYGNYKRNRGMSAPLISRNSPFHPDYSTNYNGDVYQGIFLNQDPNQTQTYYSVKADQTQTITGTTWDFYGWGKSGATLQSPNSNQTAVVFNQPNAVVTAHYKGRLRSNLISGYASNSQRKIVRTDNGIYHTVYQSDYYDNNDGQMRSRIFCSKSASTNFDGSWVQDFIISAQAFGQDYRNPSMDYFDNMLYVVYETNDGTDMRIDLVEYDTVTGVSTYRTVSGIFSNVYFGNAKPVIGVTKEQAMVVWKESSNSKLKFKVWKKSDPANSLINTFLDHSSTSSKNPSLAVGKSSLNSFSQFYIAWQNGSSEIEYQKFKQKHLLSIWSPQEDINSIISSGSGFTNHNYPSISLMEYAQATQKPIVTWRGSKKEYQQQNLAKATVGGGGSWVWKYKTVVRPYASGWGAFYEVGSNVVASTINSSDNGESVIIYSQNNGAESRYVVRDAQGVYGVLILSHNGLRSHVSNAATLSDMRAIVFNKTSLPYTLTKSTTVFQQPQNKISTEIDYTAMRQGVVKKDTLEFVFNMGDIMLDGEEVLFKTRPDTLPVNTLEELNDATRTVNFYLDNSSELFFSDIYYTAKSAHADSALSAEDEVRFQVELVRVSDGFIAGQMDKITYNRNTVEDHATIDYQLDCSGIEPGSYYLRLATAVKGDAEYFLGNGHNSVDGLAKKSYVKIGLSEISLPLSYKLEQNFPNPFNPSTTITYQIPKAGKVQIKIFDITGREITTLVDEQKEPGNYRITFDAGRLATGVYIYRIVSGDFTAQKKMLLVK